MAKKDKHFGQRAIDADIPTARENSKMNRRSNQRWANRMCCMCFQRSVVLVDGELYCKEHDPREE